MSSYDAPNAKSDLQIGDIVENFYTNFGTYDPNNLQKNFKYGIVVHGDRYRRSHLNRQDFYFLNENLENVYAVYFPVENEIQGLCYRFIQPVTKGARLIKALYGI